MLAKACVHPRILLLQLTCCLQTLDRCHTCEFIARFCRATLSHDKIASVTWHVAQLTNSHATLFPNTAVLYSTHLCRENVVNADWSIFVYTTKLQCAICTVASCAMKSRDKIAGVTSVLEIPLYNQLLYLTSIINWTVINHITKYLTPQRMEVMISPMPMS